MNTAVVTVAVEDLARADVQRLVTTHREWSHQQTPCQFSHAMDADALAAPGITLFGARDGDGRLLGIVALKQLDPGHGEIKSMHTAAVARGQGVARMLLDHLLAEARRRGYGRISLETGTTDEFLPARSLYASAGFRPSGPFGGYQNTEHNVCMSLELAHDRSGG